MEGVDLVRLPEEFVETRGPKRELDKSHCPYPNHEEVGRIIVDSQKDLFTILGGKAEANKIADLFTRSKAADQQKSKLIHSSLDMDRMDYLLRDAQATGVPYGQVDVNYLLNRLQVDKTGLIGVSQRAIPAAEHFLFARYFMYRVVYYHKTTLGFEEVCRHLLRRLRDKGEGDVPADGKAIWRIVSTKRLLQFTDSMLDQIIHDASTSRNRVIRALASTLSSRHPPQLLKEVQWFSDGKQEIAPPALFERNCKEKLASLSKKHGIPLGQFIFVETKPLKIEQRGAEILAARANELQPENEDELIRVMDGNVAKPLVETENSIIRYSSHTIFRMSRLYVVCPGGENSHAVEKLRKAVKDWDKH